MVDPHGRLRRASAAVADDWPVPQWRTELAGSRVQPMQDPGESASRRHPPTARHAALEAGGFAKMPIMPEGRYAPPVHMIKLTETREITPYRWVHPDEER